MLSTTIMTLGRRFEPTAFVGNAGGSRPVLISDCVEIGTRLRHRTREKKGGSKDRLVMALNRDSRGEASACYNNAGRRARFLCGQSHAPQALFSLHCGKCATLMGIGTALAWFGAPELFGVFRGRRLELAPPLQSLLVTGGCLEQYLELGHRVLILLLVLDLHEEQIHEGPQERMAFGGRSSGKRTQAGRVPMWPR